MGPAAHLGRGLLTQEVVEAAGAGHPVMPPLLPRQAAVVYLHPQVVFTAAVEGVGDHPSVLLVVLESVLEGGQFQAKVVAIPAF